VILNVIPAHIDFTVSESIMLSRKVDPDGERTIGVVTKIDKCEKGIRSKLEGKGPGNLILKLGYVAVRNRTQEEIDANMSFSECRMKESLYFNSHPELKNMPHHYLGIEELAKKLTDIQTSRIHAILPKIRSDIDSLLLKCHSDLKKTPFSSC